jgi:hypothetical protein
MNREGWLYGLAFLLALALRLIQLGAWPLTDVEASSALQAFHLAQGLKPALGPQPAYLLLTAPVFFAYGGATDFLARLVPALAGSFLVFVPSFFQQRIGPRPAILLAFFLALDAGLLALSRQAGSSILAITFVLFAWAFWEHRQLPLAGVFAGLALLGGTSILPGLIVFGIAFAIWRAMGRKRKVHEGQDVPDDSAGDRDRAPRAAGDWKSALTPLLITLVVFGTCFFLAPRGLGAALQSLPAYFRGWLTPSDVPAGLLLASFLFYQPLTLLLGSTAIIRGWRSGAPAAIGLSLWFLVALLLVVLYPAHQVTDLGWAVVPLCALAALELARHFDVQADERTEVAGVALLSILILVFAWLDFSGLSWIPLSSHDGTWRAWLFVVALILLVVSLVLVGFGWSPRVARLGGLWGSVIVLAIYSLSASLSAGGLRAAHTPELWSPGAYPAQADLLMSTISDLSDWDRGYVDSLPITIVNIDSPALLWVLRDYPVQVVNALDVTSAPPIVITTVEGDPSLQAAYRGQDFAWRQQPLWEGPPFLSWYDWSTHWLRWLLLRDLPQTPETILLWARDDLFLDAAPQPSP